MDRPGSAVYRILLIVPMDIYPTAHYIWPSNPTYLTDQHNIVLTVLYGAVLVRSPGISPIPTMSDSWCCHPRSSCFAAFCCAATANRFFNLPWLPRRAGIDFTHPERGLMALVMLDFTHPERGYASPGFAGGGMCRERTPARRRLGMVLASGDYPVLPMLSARGVLDDLADEIASVRVLVRVGVRRVVRAVPYVARQGRQGGQAAPPQPYRH